MATRVEFRLTMPGVGSWNGKWSGAGRDYLLVRTVPQHRIAELKIPCSWHYHWSDGWTACVEARVMEKGERAKKSAGFCGYEWMVDNILRHGSPRDPNRESGVAP